MEKTLHIILSALITILFVLYLNMANIAGDITLNNTNLIFIGIFFFLILLAINLLVVFRKK